jgi:hypothetical protein
MSFNNAQYVPQIPIKRSNEPGIERIKRPTSNPNLLQPGAPSAKILVIKEMKSIFQASIDSNSEFNIKDILKPMTQEELGAITLPEEILMQKEQKAIENQIKRLENSHKKQLSLEDLKKPE